MYNKSWVTARTERPAINTNIFILEKVFCWCKTNSLLHHLGQHLGWAVNIHGHYLVHWRGRSRQWGPTRWGSSWREQGGSGHRWVFRCRKSCFGRILACQEGPLKAGRPPQRRAGQQALALADSDLQPWPKDRSMRTTMKIQPHSNHSSNSLSTHWSTG